MSSKRNSADIADEISPAINKASDLSEAVNLNASNSIARILESAIVMQLIDSGAVAIIQERYNLETGEVEFIHAN